MKRQGTASGKAAAARRLKTASRKRRNAPKAKPDRGLSAASLQDQLDQRTRELNEALEQQQATAEVLRVISSSPGDLKPVFQTMLANAVRLCQAKFGILWLAEGDRFRSVALHDVPPVLAQARQREPIVRFGPLSGAGRVLKTKRVLHIDDITNDRGYIERDPRVVALVELGGARTVVFAPLLKDNEVIGTLVLYRQEVRPFTDKQIALAQNFAAQAVIAIENTRLLNELRQRTADLTESLEQQTATSEVLRVISSSPGELEPVFEAMLENATRICEAHFGTLLRYDDGKFLMLAGFNTPPELAELNRQRGAFVPLAGTVLDRVMRTKAASHTADDAANPNPGAPTRLGGARSTVSVPMLKDDALIGAIVIYRQEVRPFTDKQIALLRNFAAQAVIAIENTRLLNELRQRTADLTESLQQQTATADVLKVISASPGELEPVFQAMLENATRICGAKFGNLLLYDGTVFQVSAIYGAVPAFEELRRRNPTFRVGGTDNPLSRLIATKQLQHVLDTKMEPSYAQRDAGLVPLVDIAGARTFLAVPMLKENRLVGVFAIYRQEVRPFTDKQIKLVENFAAQAVIAIENTRLLNELRESLEQQTATADVLRVISSSPGDLQPVFQAMLESATRVCQAGRGTLYLREADGFRVAAFYNMTAAYAEARQSETVLRPPAGTPLGDVAATKQVAHYPDLRTAQTYIDRHPFIVAAVELGNSRTAVCVPMLKDGELIGAITISRTEVHPFTDKQIALVENFAAQAVIAIENARLLGELRESLERQTATADVLRVISSSPGDLQPVFEAVLQNAVRICDAKFGDLWLCEDDTFRFGAHYNTPAAYADTWMRERVIRPGANTGLARARQTKSVVLIADVAAEPAYAERDPLRVALVELAGGRTLVVVPMLKDDAVVGTISIYRQEVRPFTDKQIALLQNFAAQAVIAIENTRLLNELRESLDQQTATAEVLRVISASPGELPPVFNSMLENAMRLCEAKFAHLFLYQGNEFRAVGMRNVPPAWAEYLEHNTIPADPRVPLGRVALTKQVVHLADARADRAYIDRFPGLVAAVEQGGARTLLVVPMLKENELVGAISIYRQEVRPFTDKQIELVQSFAAQAVIAIENARLLNELRESLEQQTATAEVLQVINASPGDLVPVFDVMLDKAIRLCEGTFGQMYVYDGRHFRPVASRGVPPAYTEWLEKVPEEWFHTAAHQRLLAGERLVHVPDLGASDAYQSGNPMRQALVELGGARTLLSVALVKDAALVGVFTVFRQESRPFTDKQIALVQNFAAQAVIAIENARLLNELRQRTDDLARSVEELRALGDVSQAVNSTLDLQTVLDTIVAKAVQLADTEAGAIYVFDEAERGFHLRATYGMDQELIDALSHRHIGIDEANVARAFAQDEPIQIADLREEPRSELNDLIVRAGYRARLLAPLMRGDEIVGMLLVRRKTPGVFAQNTVDLMKTFAAQSVLAIQNARLFHEIDDKSRQVEEASKHKSQFLANMSHELRTPLNAILGYTELILDSIYGEAPAKMRAVLERVQTNGKHLLGLINDVLDLSKIEAGQLSLSLNDYSIQDMVQGVYVAVEPLANSKKLAFTIEVPPNLPPARGDDRRLSQVLLNLVGNAIKFTDKGEVAIRASAANGSYTIAVRDTGPGIAAEDQAKIFEEFQQADNSQTKSKGGTGLGLSIAKRIVELHGGRLWVESSPGNGATFSFTVPLRVEQEAGRG